MTRAATIVVLFTDVLPSGGVQRAGRQVAAVTAKFASERGLVTRFLSLNDAQGLHTVRSGSQEFSVSGYDRSKARFALAALRAAGRNPALVVAMHPHLAPIVWAMRTRSRTFRSIVFAHGVEVWKPLGWPRRAALRRANLVLGPSRDTIQHLISEQRIPADKVRLLFWGLDPEFEHSVEAAIVARPPGFPEKGRVVLTVGRWDASEKYKGADTLIAALSRVTRTTPDVFLVAVGRGDDRPRLERLAREMGLSESVRFLEGLSPAELSACYAGCDVFALPSKGEGFGFVFLEAMAHSKPVIGGAHGGIPDIVEDGVNGLLVPHGDVERLAQSLEFFLADPARAKEMGAAGKQRVTTLFSSTQFESRLTEVLSDAVGSEPAPAKASIEKSARGV